jgi:hypothetical protein
MLTIPKVGSTVKITTRYAETYLFSKNKWRDSVTVGQIVSNQKWVPVGSFSVTTGMKEFPIAVIAIRNLVKIEHAGKTLSAKIKKTAAKTWKVKSSRGNEIYTVINNSGAWSCTCVGFQYHRKCKHITNLQSKGTK